MRHLGMMATSGTIMDEIDERYLALCLAMMSQAMSDLRPKQCNYDKELISTEARRWLLHELPHTVYGHYLALHGAKLPLPPSALIHGEHKTVYFTRKQEGGRLAHANGRRKAC